MIDPVEALDRAMAAADRANGDRAILWRIPAARAEAEQSRDRHRNGTTRGPLDGIPVVVKDSIDVAGVPSTNGTKFLTAPAAKDATVVQRLRAAGAIVFAKANMHEFGIQPTGINPHHGTPVNPWDPRRIPGGSSSGSAVAVASGIATMAVGTDSGGSIRVPSAINGLTGLKPTNGAVPIDGIAPLAGELDHAGPIARTVEDATLLFEVLSQQSIDRRVKAERPALLTELFADDDTVRRAAREVFGAIDEVSAPLAAWAPSVIFVIIGAESAVTCGRFMRDHERDIAPDTRIILRLGSGLSRDDRDRAERVRRAMRDQIDALLEAHDVLIGPATGCVAPFIRRSARRYGQLDTAKIAAIAAQAFVANLTGHPAAVVPCVREGLPAAMQIIGRKGEDARVLAAARAVEARFGWRRPPRWYGEVNG